MKANSGLSISAAITSVFVASVYHKPNKKTHTLQLTVKTKIPLRSVEGVSSSNTLRISFSYLFWGGVFCLIILFLIDLELPEKNHWQVSLHLNTSVETEHIY